MKRTVLVACALLLAMPICCKRGGQGPQEAVLSKKYAKYEVHVTRDKELKTWAATLEKGEGVDLLQEEKFTTPAGKAMDVSKVKLADDTVAYIETRHLADKVIVFIEDSKAYLRPAADSRVIATIPQGTIAFVVGEKASWIQVYAGKIDGKWITKEWVSRGFSEDQQVLVDARTLESALSMLKSDNAAKRAEGQKKLEEVSRSSTVPGEMARRKLAELAAGTQENPAGTQPSGQPAEAPSAGQ